MLIHSYRREGRQLRFPMASVSLVSSPPAPVLDKNMTDSELAGDERSSNILMQFLIRSSVRFSAVGLHACVTVLSLIFNHQLQKRLNPRFSPSNIYACSLVQFLTLST